MHLQLSHNNIIGSCVAPSSLSNGQSNYTSITVGSIVTYTCEAGYKLTGVSRQTCQSNGQWSDSQPSCDRELIYVLVTHTHARTHTHVHA